MGLAQVERNARLLSCLRCLTVPLDLLSAVLAILGLRIPSAGTKKGGSILTSLKQISVTIASIKYIAQV